MREIWIQVITSMFIKVLTVMMIFRTVLFNWSEDWRGWEATAESCFLVFAVVENHRGAGGEWVVSVNGEQPTLPDRLAWRPHFFFFHSESRIGLCFQHKNATEVCCVVGWHVAGFDTDWLKIKRGRAKRPRGRKPRAAGWTSSNKSCSSAWMWQMDGGKEDGSPC